MKQTIDAKELEPGVVEVKHEIEILCSHCQDPVSAEEEASGTCTNCGESWSPIQHVSLYATSQPMSGASA